jgi:hypothetical protein
MPFDRTNSVAILRCVDFGEMEAALLERLRSYFGANIVIQRNVEAETRPFALDVPNDILVLSADTSAIRNLGLVAPADWGWRCGDYAQIHVADHLQEFDHYWMFEPDVFFNFRELADFFGPLESNDADFLAPQLSRRDNQWAHFRSVEEIFPEVWGCLYPVTRISRRAIAAVHQARRDYGEAWLRQAAPRSFANDESFVCSALHAAGFRMESLNTASPSVFPDDNYSFTFNRLILRERVEREESVVLHPVVSSAVFFDKLRPRMTKNIMPHLYYYSEIVREMGDDETNAWFGRKAAEVIRARHDTRKDSRGTETASSAEISLISEKVRESMWKNSSQKDFGLHAPMKIDAIDFRRNFRERRSS